MLRNIIYKQNEALLKDISQRYDLNYDILAHKYLTPSFYDIGMRSDKIYEVKFT
jgi:hypothetical protein